MAPGVAVAAVVSPTLGSRATFVRVVTAIRGMDVSGRTAASLPRVPFTGTTGATAVDVAYVPAVVRPAARRARSPRAPLPLGSSVPVSFALGLLALAFDLVLAFSALTRLAENVEGSRVGLGRGQKNGRCSDGDGECGDGNLIS
jgi:hypothetical protein